MRDEQDLEATYGPAAPYSEHKPGETIIYRIDGFTYRGEILWVCAACLVGEKKLPLRYVVAPALDTGFVEIVFPADVIAEQAHE